MWSYRLTADAQENELIEDGVLTRVWQRGQAWAPRQSEGLVNPM